ncbi:lasso peptide biosynthesis B2 protein [Brevundimonas viscosa]|uniref:Transglutaminase-like superfamily protein n=1 Tax=Brevundimonas viscosa TaxID=871741 RepID=A0A1I6SNN3_9CAUL|nr:lasso peptide biosynthesis B2 protein [Brevundimonas viscosa]SFS78536.1 Transglutaminase-like superfamily protein [Brevundimonas viscosa]
MTLDAPFAGKSSGLPLETRPVAAGVFMARVGDDVVLLDLRSDAYACLAGVGDGLVLTEAGVRADLGLLDLLADADLLERDPGPPRRPLPTAPLRELDLPRLRWPLAHASSLLAAAWRAASVGSRAPIRDLIGALPPPPSARPDPARVASVVSGFRRLLPWVPGQGACLYRAFVLLTMLRRVGQDATWVFGVRTWPFGAHCWLQLEDAVLDDDPERVARYTPIMAVQ